jgi:hypothetical protein
MRTLFLIFLGFLIYRFLIKPLFLGFNDSHRQGPINRDRMNEMMRRMQEFQHQQNRRPGQQEVKKNPGKKSDDGEYIDYEEVD